MAYLKSFCLLSASFLFIQFGLAKSAEIKFEKTQIKIAGKQITVELAKTPAQQQQGLMFRTALNKDEGMLFVFSNEDYRAFWMRNTFIDLSIGYFDKNRVLKEIYDMKATTSLDLHFPTYPSQSKAQYALEMTKGWFKKNKVKIGDKFDWN